MNSTYTKIEVNENPDIFFYCPSQKEMLRISPEGFYVRGEKVPVDGSEAMRVYKAFKDWMSIGFSFTTTVKPQAESVKHTGFCLDNYNPETCDECPCEKECLDLYASENKLEVDELDPEGHKVGC